MKRQTKLLWLMLLWTVPHEATSRRSPPQVVTQEISLEGGSIAQVLVGTPTTKGKKNRPPLVFLHGSFHGAWCWNEYYMPYFLSQGYPVVATNWRGTSGHPVDAQKVHIDDHVQDLTSLLEHLPSIIEKTTKKKSKHRGVKPVLVVHSFGGLYVMRYLQILSQNGGNASSELSGIILMSSVPPSGMGGMTQRLLWRSLWDTIKIIRAFPMKQATNNAALARDLFFGGPPLQHSDGSVDDWGVSDEDLARYQAHFVQDSNVATDISLMERDGPSKYLDDDGKSQFASTFPPVLVIETSDDFLVDHEGNVETATFFGVSEGPVIIDSPHDAMLGRKWKNGANVIEKWLEETIPQCR